MRLRSVVPAGLLSAAVSIAFAADDASSAYPADAYATCAACHLPDGAGIPGAFPPIRNRAATIASLDGGRAYLATVVSYGLMGTINVAGSQYFGVMAGNVGAMSPEDIAAALNYVIFELNDADAIDLEPYTAEEVAEAQAAVSTKSPAAGGDVRSRLVDDHGDEWP